jgi:tetratricopeptide (TPR) repeat protein
MIRHPEWSNFVNSLWKMMAALLLAVLLLPSSATAQGHGMNNLQVKVDVRFEDNRSAPAGVIVDLEYGDGVPFAHSQTDSSGKVRFIPDQATIYIVRAKQPGYKEATARLNLQNTQSGYAILILKRDPNQPAPTNEGGAVSVADLAPPGPARKEYDLGQHALESRDLDSGITHLKKAIALQDQYPQAYTLLGMAYNEQKKWKEAQGVLEKAIQQDPKAGEAYVQLGSSLLQQQDYTGAEKALNQGLQLNPDALSAPMAHYNLATAYLTTGQWKDAEPHAAKAIAATPDFAVGHWLMAQIMLKKGDGQGAINEFQSYLKLDPNGSFAPSVRAVIPKIEAAIQKK